MGKNGAGWGDSFLRRAGKNSSLLMPAHLLLATFLLPRHHWPVSSQIGQRQTEWRAKQYCHDHIIQPGTQWHRQQECKSKPLQGKPAGQLWCVASKKKTRAGRQHAGGPDQFAGMPQIIRNRGKADYSEQGGAATKQAEPSLCAHWKRRRVTWCVHGSKPFLAIRVRYRCRSDWQRRGSKSCVMAKCDANMMAPRINVKENEHLSHRETCCAELCRFCNKSKIYANSAFFHNLL